LIFVVASTSAGLPESTESKTFLGCRATTTLISLRPSSGSTAAARAAREGYDNFFDCDGMGTTSR
jgi:hypothetical protein